MQKTVGAKGVGASAAARWCLTVLLLASITGMGGLRLAFIEPLAGWMFWGFVAVATLIAAAVIGCSFQLHRWLAPGTGLRQPPPSEP